MKRLRLSIASLMAFVVYAAIGFAAFSKVNDRYYGRLLDDTYYMVTVFLLGIATIMAILSPDRSRGGGWDSPCSAGCICCSAGPIPGARRRPPAPIGRGFPTPRTSTGCSFRIMAGVVASPRGHRGFPPVPAVAADESAVGDLTSGITSKRP